MYISQLKGIDQEKGKKKNFCTRNGTLCSTSWGNVGEEWHYHEGEISPKLMKGQDEILEPVRRPAVTLKQLQFYLARNTNFKAGPNHPQKCGKMSEHVKIFCPLLRVCVYICIYFWHIKKYHLSMVMVASCHKAAPLYLGI